MNKMATLRTAIWLPIVRNEEDYELLPDAWKVTGYEGFNVYRASVLEKHEALAERAKEAQGVVIDVLVVKATPQYMLSRLMDRAYTIQSANNLARLMALAPDHDPSREYGV